MGDIITEVANRRLAIPCLSGSEPLELLLEIGLEKLYKDYEFIFTESQVCNANTLKSKDKYQKLAEVFFFLFFFYILHNFIFIKFIVKLMIIRKTANRLYVMYENLCTLLFR